MESTPIDLLEDRQVLCLDGIGVDSIAVIGDVYSEAERDSKEILSRWKTIANVDKGGEYQFTGQSIREAFWRTLLLDLEHQVILRSKERIPLPSNHGTLDFSASFPLDDQNDFDFVQNLIGRVSMRTNGRRFFKTEKGLTGLASASIKQGDRVVVLLEGRAPFILRQLEWYQVIGER